MQALANVVGKGGPVTGWDTLGVLTALLLVFACLCGRRERLRAISIWAQVVVFGCAILIGSAPLLVANVVGLALNLARLRGRKSDALRARTASDMDHDVQERIRAISADSRYSSAGIEF